MSQKQLAPSKPFTRKKIENFSYGLNDTIGKGYSSQVYKGRNDLTEESVAVKVIDLKMLKCQINRTLLTSQIQILKSMKNVPHVLTLHQVYTTKNNTYIITELCQSDLSRKIKKGISESEAFNYMSQFLQGYSYIYEKNLIHRDLKPANLLVTPENQLKIADFGFGIKAEEVLHPSKYNVGSPLYMAPQSLKRNEYSFKTDIWAIGIIFFEMLTGDTPWRAKNEKELIKKIQGEKIDSILSRKNFSSLVKQFLTKALSHDKLTRLGPQELTKYNFYRNQSGILAEKQLNNLKLQKFESIINQATSPKNYSAKSLEKRIFNNQNERSEKKIPSKGISSTQNMSLKNIENLGKKPVCSPHPKNPELTIEKEDRKGISKLLISEVHFCRFLYKLLGRIKQSGTKGVLADSIGEKCASSVLSNFTCIIKQKIIKLKEFEDTNFLQIQKYEEYKVTSDFKKLIKISKDYYDRYSFELRTYWNSPKKIDYVLSVSSVFEMIKYLTSVLNEKISALDHPVTQIHIYSKDIIILDYLITCKQLLSMLIKDGENYEKFARKSRIEEIVEGATSEINFSLYTKIVERARSMIDSEEIQS